MIPSYEKYRSFIPKRLAVTATFFAIVDFIKDDLREKKAKIGLKRKEHPYQTRFFEIVRFQSIYGTSLKRVSALCASL